MDREKIINYILSVAKKTFKLGFNFKISQSPVEMGGYIFVELSKKTKCGLTMSGMMHFKEIFDVKCDYQIRKEINFKFITLHSLITSKE